MKPTRVLMGVAAILLILVLVPGVRAETYGYVTEFGGYGTGDGKFSAPAGVAVNSSDYVYVVDYMQNRIQVFTSDGTYVTQWGSTGSGDRQFAFPWGIAVNSSHLVYVADQNNDRVQVFDPTGGFLFKWGSTGSDNGQFQDPWAIAVNSSGYVYVSDFNRVQVFDPVGTFVTQRASSGSGPGQFNGIQGLAVDTAGNVYVADYNNYRVQKFTPSLVNVTQWGSFGSGNGQFNGPRGVAVDAAGNVYVADSYNNRIQKFASDGTYVTEWGSYGFMGGQFYLPDGIAVDSSGNVWVGDASDRIQKFALIPAPVAAFSGTPPLSGSGPLNVIFTDESIRNPSGWAWFFGDENYTASWTQMTAGAGWSARHDLNSVVLQDGSIVLIGGIDGIGPWVTDVWRSTDKGATWTQQTPNAGWTPRWGFSSVALPDGEIEMMGGWDGSSGTNDTWFSANGGYTWAPHATNAEWPARELHSSVVMPDGSIVLMGGAGSSTRLNDVWRSIDKGATWTQMTASAGWSARQSHSSVAMPDGSIVLMGGYGDSGRLNDVWRSTDEGATWTQMTTHAGWTARDLLSVVAMPDGSIVVMGGADGGYPNDVWRSTDIGATWTQVTASAGWSGRDSFGSVVLPDGSIVVMGGSNGGAYTNDVWRLTTAGSSAQNPSHTYTKPGTYQVALQAYNAVGYNSTRKTGYIMVTAQAPTPISCPAVISSPGTYELQNDCANTPFVHPWDGITITSSDVVLDGMGHTINGFDDAGWTDVHGVYASGSFGAPLSNIHVRNLTVNGTYQGIYYYVADGGVIENITGRNNYISSVFLHFSNLTMVQNSTATNDGDSAFGISTGLWNILINNVASNNKIGFGIYYGKSNYVMNNTVENNHIGIDLLEGSSPNNFIFGNVIRNNDGYGIQSDKTGDDTFPTAIYNNYFFNENNTQFVGFPKANIWNTTKTAGTNIIGGSFYGGNYWANASGTEFSQTCTDADSNGICDSPYTIAPGGNIDAYPLTALTTPDDAGTFVCTTYHIDLTKQGLWVGPYVLPGSFTVRTIGIHSTLTMPDYPGYVAFIDDNPNANWDHAARIVYVEDTKVNPRTAEYKVSSQLADVDLSYNGGMLSDPTGDVTTPPPGAPACVDPYNEHYYALLISGGIQKEANYVRYRNDMAFMYQTLTQKYGYPKDHIIVLMSDGNDPALDQLTNYDSNNYPVYADSKTDLDYVADGISDVNDAATRTSVLTTLDELRSALHTDDNLFIFTTNHGANMHTGEPNDPYDGDVILYLWGAGEEGWISDADFVNALPGSPLYPNTGAKSITMVMEQCFGGGFSDNFLDPTSLWNTPKRVIATAADFNEYSWGNAYSFQWINGEWFNAWSMQDAHVNARLNDRYNTTYYLEHPKFLCTPDTGGTTQYLADCSGAPPAPSITVTAPKADTWYTGQTRDIEWTQTGLSGKTVNIELWKGSATAKTLDIVPSPVDATIGTKQWLIPTTFTAARDYYIKIYQSDAPGVSGRSEGFLTINRGRGAGTGKLWVNSTPVPNPNEEGAMIYIDGELQKDPITGAKNLTNSSVWLLAGTHVVGVERMGYYAPETTANVPQAGTLVLKFQLEPVSTNDCPPFGIMDIQSTPEQDAKITIVDEQHPGTVITGLFTNTKTQIAPGIYTVTVEHDRYQTATQSGVTIKVPPCPAGEVRAELVKFDLVPTEDVRAIVKIVPRSLNLASKGYFMAFVTLPSGYKAADVIADSVVCEGATALKLIRHKLFPRTFVAIFRRSDLVDVPTGNSVPMTVTGSIKKTGGNPEFSGTDKIKVISNKVTTREDVDDWGKMTDEKVFSQFNPGYSKDDEKVFSQSNQKDDRRNEKDNGKSR